MRRFGLGEDPQHRRDRFRHPALPALGQGTGGEVDITTGEVELDVPKIQGAVESDISAILGYAGLAHWKD